MSDAAKIDPAKLLDMARRMRSDCSFVESRGLEQFRAMLLPYIPEIEAIAGVGAAGAVSDPPASGEDRLLTVKQVAEMLGVSTDHVYRHAPSWPFTRRVGTKALRFSEQGLAFWLQQQKKAG